MSYNFRFFYRHLRILINLVDDPNGHEIQLKLTLNTQAQLVDVLVQTFSGVIQGGVVFSEKDKNVSKTCEMDLEGL